MSYPTQPSLSLTAASSTSFTATVSGADSGGTVRTYYRQVGSVAAFTTGPTIAGSSGSATVTGLAANAGYIVYAVGDDGSGYSLPSVAAISLATTDSLSGALVAVLSNNSAFSTLCSQAWDEEIPENILGPGGVPQRVELPFAVVKVDEEANDNFTFEQAYYVDATVKIEFYAPGDDQVEKIRIAADAALDWQSLPFSVATTISVDPQGVTHSSEDILDRNGNKVFDRTIKFLVRYTRSL